MHVQEEVLPYTLQPLFVCWRLIQINQQTDVPAFNIQLQRSWIPLTTLYVHRHPKACSLSRIAIPWKRDLLNCSLLGGCATLWKLWLPAPIYHLGLQVVRTKYILIWGMHSISLLGWYTLTRNQSYWLTSGQHYHKLHDLKQPPQKATGWSKKENTHCKSSAAVLLSSHALIVGKVSTKFFPIPNSTCRHQRKKRKSTWINAYQIHSSWSQTFEWTEWSYTFINICPKILKKTHWEVDVVNWCSRLDGQKTGSELPNAPVVVEECEAHNHGESKGDGRSYHRVLYNLLQNSKYQPASPLESSKYWKYLSTTPIHFFLAFRTKNAL